MNDNPFEAVPTEVDNCSNPTLYTVATLVEKATAFLESRGDYCERLVRYIGGTWCQFRKHCDTNGFVSYQPECRESFIQSLSTGATPLKPGTIKRKEGNLKMLDLYAKDGTWEKGALDPKPNLNEEFSRFITAQDDFLKKRCYSEFSRKSICKQTTAVLNYFQNKGIIKLSDITSDSISAYAISLKGHAKSTMRGELSRIRQVLHIAYLLEYTSDDLSVYVPTYSLGQPQSNVKIWNSDEINKVLDTVDRSNPKGLRDAAYITIASELGMRSKDIADLKLSDFDWEVCSISFTQSKTGKANPLPLNEKTGRAIIEYLRVRPDTDCEYLFVSMNPPYDKMKSFNSSFDKYVNRSGVTVPANAHHNLHSLRATVATRLLEEGVSPDDIVSFLGHSDRESLHNYIRMDIENLRACALTFEDGEFV